MYVNGDLTNTMDIAAQTPIIEKNNIVLEINTNGEVLLQMIKRMPSQSVEIPHLTLIFLIVIKRRLQLLLSLFDNLPMVSTEKFSIKEAYIYNNLINLKAKKNPK